MSTRWMIGSSMVRGRSARMRAIGVLDVVERAVGVGLQPELDRGDGRAVGDGRDDVLDAVDAGDGVLDSLRHLHLELGGAAPDCVTRDRDDGHVDVREARDRQRLEAHAGPATMSTKNSTIEGTGLRIDQAEMFIGWPHSPSVRARPDARRLLRAGTCRPWRPRDRLRQHPT